MDTMERGENYQETFMKIISNLAYNILWIVAQEDDEDIILIQDPYTCSWDNSKAISTEI